MAWFDCTFDTTMEEIEEKYPVKVTEDLRTTEDKSRIAIINRFTESDPRFAPSDPDLKGKKVFYHIFDGAEARKAREFITRFIADGHGENEEAIDLYRSESGRLSEYSYGELQTESVSDQETLRQTLPEELKSSEVFILPLKSFLYPCPVCGKRTLEWRGMFIICEECGWEDIGTTALRTDDEGYESMTNGGRSIRTYRADYLKLKQADPDYKWFIE